MPLDSDEAEALARKVISNMQREQSAVALSWADVRALCDHILSGSMKREIENAAYRRCIEIADRAMLDGRSAAARSNRITIRQIKSDIRALIQPPAQKKDGK